MVRLLHARVSTQEVLLHLKTKGKQMPTGQLQSQVTTAALQNTLANAQHGHGGGRRRS